MQSSPSLSFAGAIDVLDGYSVCGSGNNIHGDPLATFHIWRRALVASFSIAFAFEFRAHARLTPPLDTEDLVAGHVGAQVDPLVVGRLHFFG